MAILEIRENFLGFSVVSVMMGFPVLGVVVVGMVALMGLFGALRRFDTFAAVSRVMMGYLTVAVVHVAVSGIWYSMNAASFGDMSRQVDFPAFSFFSVWFVLYLASMKMLYWQEDVKDSKPKQPA